MDEPVEIQAAAVGDRQHDRIVQGFRYDKAVEVVDIGFVHQLIEIQLAIVKDRDLLGFIAGTFGNDEELDGGFGGIKTQPRFYLEGTLAEEEIWNKGYQ